MTHWSAPLSNIFESESVGLRDLARSVGADPAIFYVNQDLSKCDLRGQDLRGMNLSGTSITASQMDGNTRLDPEYDPRFVFDSQYISFRVPLGLLALIYGYADESRYVYKAWAFKNLIEASLSFEAFTSSIEEFIHSNGQFSKLVDPREKPYKRVRVQIYRHLQELAFNWAMARGRRLDGSVYLELMMLSLVRRRLGDLRGKDYSNIMPLSLYVSAQRHYDSLLSGSG